MKNDLNMIKTILKVTKKSEKSLPDRPTGTGRFRTKNIIFRNEKYMRTKDKLKINKIQYN